MRAIAVVFTLALLLPRPAAADDKFHITSAERAACTSDAMHLCMWSYPDEDKLLSCMKANRPALSTGCRVAFDAGVRRRHL